MLSGRRALVTARATSLTANLFLPSCLWIPSGWWRKRGHVAGVKSGPLLECDIVQGTNGGLIYRGSGKRRRLHPAGFR